MNELRAVPLLAVLLALGACDQSPLQAPSSTPQPSAPQSATPAAAKTVEDCPSAYFYNFSDARGGGKILCPAEQPS
jgi:hypothetical protein